VTHPHQRAMVAKKTLRGCALTMGLI